MKFEFFTDSGRGFRPKVSIRKQGQIGLNHGAVRRFSIDKWRYAVLGYDRERRTIALKLTNDENEPGAQRIIIKNDSGSVSARAFLEYFDIPYRESTEQYDVRMDSERNMLIVRLESGENQASTSNEEV